MKPAYHLACDVITACACACQQGGPPQVLPRHSHKTGRGQKPSSLGVRKMTDLGVRNKMTNPILPYTGHRGTLVAAGTGIYFQDSLVVAGLFSHSHISVREEKWGWMLGSGLTPLKTPSGLPLGYTDTHNRLPDSLPG